RGSACWRGRRRRYSRRRCSRASRPCSRIFREPAETVGGLAARIVFATDEAGVAEPVDLLEHERIIQLLAVGLVARGNAGDLHMTDDRDHRAQVHRDVAMNDLAVIDVELQL